MHNIFIDIFPRHVEGKRLDKTVWSLLNFYAYVKYHVKVTFLSRIFFPLEILIWFFLRLLSICPLTSLADKIAQTVYQRFYSKKDEEAFGKFGWGNLSCIKNSMLHQ